MEQQSNRNQLIEWLKEIVPYNNLDKYVRLRDAEGQHLQRLVFCTEAHTYAISAHFEGDRTYLGCIASARKMRAGEDWTRGNDLPDGDFSRQTWERIKNAIIRHEMIELEPVKAASELTPTIGGALCHPDDLAKAKGTELA
jgi:hypothetical protein